MPAPPPRKAHRLPWADLLRRVFLGDVLDCPKCHGRMRLVAAVMEAAAVERILCHFGREPRAPSLTPARAPPERDPIRRAARRFRRPSALRRLPRAALAPEAIRRNSPTRKTTAGSLFSHGGA
jgi:hypothetical protein